jgi:hypothetical protein
MNRIKEMSIIEEEKGNIPEELVKKAVQTSAVLRFRLLFLSNNENKTIQKVEVKNLNYQDLMRHLQRGESVFIIPKLLEDSSKDTKKQEDRAPWYFAHL